MANELYNFKTALWELIKKQDKVHDYPDASERRNNVQTDIDQTVYEVMQDFYNK